MKTIRLGDQGQDEAALHARSRDGALEISEIGVAELPLAFRLNPIQLIGDVDVIAENTRLGGNICLLHGELQLSGIHFSLDRQP